MKCFQFLKVIMLSFPSMPDDFLTSLNCLIFLTWLTSRLPQASPPPGSLTCIPVQAKVPLCSLVPTVWLSPAAWKLLAPDSYYSTVSSLRVETMSLILLFPLPITVPGPTNIWWVNKWRKRKRTGLADFMRESQKKNQRPPLGLNLSHQGNGGFIHINKGSEDRGWYETSRKQWPDKHDYFASVFVQMDLLYI